MIIKIPEDIDKYEPKTWGNFTTRQFISILIALPILAGIFAGLFYLTADTTIAGLIALVVSMPILLSGFSKTQGLYFNEILKRKLEDNKYSKPRPYVSHNLYCDLEKMDKLIEDWERQRSYVVENEKNKKCKKQHFFKRD